ncbi:NACHT domain-containing NTPase [Streptomyces sp. SBR177]
MPVPQRIDELLGPRPRVLLRGDAGAGKTTLVWWLAAHAAAGTLGPGLAELNGLVPSSSRCAPCGPGTPLPLPGELPGVAGLMIDPAPAGWAGRVLAAGRALLLVDGLDEVTQDDRDEAHRWLGGLLARYPQTRCVATVRPHAVAPDWLGGERFEELTLLPLRGEDIQAFVTAWHDAARLDADPGSGPPSTGSNGTSPSSSATTPTSPSWPVPPAVRRDLRPAPDTGGLPARDPLGALRLGPHHAARHPRRTPPGRLPDGIRMSVEEHQELLQRLAAWLVRAGQTEFTRDQALQRLERALPGMPRVRDQGTPEEVLTHVINRSGLLQERTNDVFQFAHRTFQDFLAAKEFVEDDSLREALRHAHDQQWHDVLLLAAGHCKRRELPVLVEGLLEAGSATRRRDLKTTLYVMAALAAQHRPWLEEGLRRRVEKAVRSVVPPRNRDQLAQLARLGGWVLPLLPAPEQITPDTLDMVTALIASVGGDEALPYARAFAEAGHSEWFVNQWSAFPAEGFARDVLAHLGEGQSLVVETAQQLRLVGSLPGATGFLLLGDFTEDDLVRHLGGRPLTYLGLCGAPVDLAVLRALDCSRLVNVVIMTRSPGIGLGPLAELPALRYLTVDMPPNGGGLDLTPLRAMPGLQVTVHGAARRLLVGADALGDRLTVA